MPALKLPPAPVRLTAHEKRMAEYAYAKIIAQNSAARWGGSIKGYREAALQKARANLSERPEHYYYYAPRGGAA